MYRFSLQTFFSGNRLSGSNRRMPPGRRSHSCTGRTANDRPRLIARDARVSCPEADDMIAAAREAAGFVVVPNSPGRSAASSRDRSWSSMASSVTVRLTRPRRKPPRTPKRSHLTLTPPGPAMIDTEAGVFRDRSRPRSDTAADAPAIKNCASPCGRVLAPKRRRFGYRWLVRLHVLLSREVVNRKKTQRFYRKV